MTPQVVCWTTRTSCWQGRILSELKDLEDDGHRHGRAEGVELQ